MGSEVRTDEEHDEHLAALWEQANACPSCDGFHPDHTGWAGVRCTVGTGIQPYHWRPDNEGEW